MLVSLRCFVLFSDAATGGGLLKKDSGTGVSLWILQNF